MNHVRPQRYLVLTAWLLAVLIAFGALTLWVRERWALTIFQCGILGVAAAWSWANAICRGPVRLHISLLPLGLLPLWAWAQVVFHLSEAPWYTFEKLAEWTVTLCACFLIWQVAYSYAPLRARLLTALLAFASLIAVQALLQLFTSEGKVFWLFESGYTTEVLGPFVSRNKYAQFIEIVFPLALWRAIVHRRRAPIYLVAAAIMAAGVIAGASRAGVAFLLVEIFAVILIAWRQEALSGRAGTALAAQTAGLVLLWGFLAGFDYLLARLAGNDPLGDYRWPIMASTLKMVRHYPWFGVGLSAWPLVYPEFATFDAGVIVNQAHCDWLQWLAEGGWPFLAAVIAVVGTLVRPLIRSVWGVGFLVVCVHACLDFPFHQLPAFTTFLFAAASLAAADGEGRPERLG